MSPEQARGDALDARSDLFSLAAVLYEVFTDRRLFVGQVGQSPTEVYGEVAPPSQVCAELPPGLDAVLLRGLALPATERPASAKVLYQELLELAKQSGLYMDRAEFSAHLHTVCGADPAEWSSIEERTGTALIAPISAQDIADHDEPSGGLIEHASSMGPGGRAAIATTGKKRDRSESISQFSQLEKITLPPADEAFEPSEPAITVPWPTVLAVETAASSGVPIADHDDTMPFPSGPVSISDSQLGLRPKSLLHKMLDFDSDADAVTGPAEKTAPSEKLHDPAMPTPMLLGTGLQHQVLLAQVAERQKAVRRFSAARRASFAYGLFAGLVISLLLLWALANRPLPL
jgi:hypothetical protein